MFLSNALQTILARTEVVRVSDETRYPDFFFWIMLLSAVGLSVYVTILVRRATKANREQEREENEFARRLAGEADRATLKGTAPKGEAARARTKEAEDVPAPATPPEAEDAPQALPAFAASITAKLRQTTFMDGVIGPFQSPDPGLVGTVIEVSGERVLILESRMPERSEPLEMILRQYGGVITPGPGGDPVFIRRFDSWLGDFYDLG